MNPVAFNQLLDRLPELSAAQIKQVMLRFKAMGSLSKDSSLTSTDDIVTSFSLVSDDWLLDGIFVELKNRGLQKTFPANFQIRSSKSFGAYAEKAARLREWIEEQIPDLKLVEKRAIGIILARCLALYIVSWTEISLETMLRLVGELPRALEKSFPGYLAAGLLRVLITREIEEEK